MCIRCCSHDSQQGSEEPSSKPWIAKNNDALEIVQLPRHTSASDGSENYGGGHLWMTSSGLCWFQVLLSSGSALHTRRTSRFLLPLSQNTGTYGSGGSCRQQDARPLCFCGVQPLRPQPLLYGGLMERFPAATLRSGGAEAIRVRGGSAVADGLHRRCLLLRDRPGREVKRCGCRGRSDP